ncbi:MAG: YHS domain protein [Alphaproteobacteria bacterium]|nr:YHS domain protein [Alphaproteobacteria bacterium]
MTRPRAAALSLSRRDALLALLSLGLAGTAARHAAGQAAPPAATSAVNVEDGVAIRGTDPVAYFTDGRPVAGRRDITAEWGGATWRFASVANRERFLAEPARYAPQYGGFCAWAVAEGYKAPIDPRAWRIVDGRLYLNYSASIQRRWERDVPGNITRADQNWPRIAVQ